MNKFFVFTAIIALITLGIPCVTSLFVPSVLSATRKYSSTGINSKRIVLKHCTNHFALVPKELNDSGSFHSKSTVSFTANSGTRGFFLSQISSSVAIIGSSVYAPLVSHAVETNSLSSQATKINNIDATNFFSVYQDNAVGFEIKVPAEWQKSEQSLPDRRKIVLFINDKLDNTQEKDLMFVAYTSVRDDFTSLSSFGSVDQVAQMTILPKGQIAGRDSEGNMILAESKKNSYYFDYTSKSSGQPERHFRTIFTLIQGATGGAGSVLVTITLQTTEDRYHLLKPMFDEIIDSYTTTTRKK
jgi:hypothetical protein